MYKRLVSIIIPNRNCSKWIRQCIQSCLNQTYPHIEIIVIDDASTDNSVPILQEYGTRIKLIQNKTQLGPGAARNIGLEHARGEYVQYLDADDYISKYKIELQLATLIQNRADLCAGNYKRVFSIGVLNLPGFTIEVNESMDLYKEVLSDVRWIPVHVYLYRRSLIEKVGRWREDLTIYGEDRVYRHDTLRLMPKMDYVNKTLFYYREHNRESLSKSFRDSLFADELSLYDIDKDYVETCLLPDFRKGLLSGNERRNEALKYLKICLRYNNLPETRAVYFKKIIREISSYQTQDSHDISALRKISLASQLSEGIGTVIRKISQRLKKMINFDYWLNKSNSVYLIDRWMKHWHSYIREKVSGNLK